MEKIVSPQSHLTSEPWFRSLSLSGFVGVPLSHFHGTQGGTAGFNFQAGPTRIHTFMRRRLCESSQCLSEMGFPPMASGTSLLLPRESSSPTVGVPPLNRRSSSHVPSEGFHHRLCTICQRGVRGPGNQNFYPPPPCCFFSFLLLCLHSEALPYFRLPAAATHSYSLTVPPLPGCPAVSAWPRWWGGRRNLRC